VVEDSLENIGTTMVKRISQLVFGKNILNRRLLFFGKRKKMKILFEINYIVKKAIPKILDLKNPK
jgi:hypothetical protein